ncbi:hypothetical protein TNCV_2547441 [Trichonephila clavipes]|nr:hypothetical protein TNCV_2547441 [Trichonephila clavipes]
MTARLKLCPTTSFFDANGLYKQNKHSFGGGVSGRDGFGPWICPCRAAYSNASGLSGSVTGNTVVERCSGKASIGSMTKRLKHLSLLYVSNRMRLQKEAVESLNASVTVPKMDGPWMSIQTLSVEKILGVKSF